MMAARTLNDTLVSLANSHSLTAQTAATAEAPLQDAYNAAQTYVKAHPEAAKPAANGASPMWFRIDDSLARELGDTNELRQALNDPHDSQEVRFNRLNQVTAEFNSMVKTYNLLAQNGIGVV